MDSVAVGKKGRGIKPEMTLKPLRWVGDTRTILRSFPEEVRYEIGTALRRAQQGAKDADAKPLKGFGDA